MSPKTCFFAAAAVLVAATSGCANHFTSSFRAIPNYAGPIPPAEPGPTPRLIVTADPQREIDQLKQTGYTVIGTAAFDDDWKPRHLLRKDAISAGRFVGAEVVVLRKFSAEIPPSPEPNPATPAAGSAQEFRYYAVYLRHG